MTDGLPAPIVDSVPAQAWYTFEVGIGNMIKTVIQISASGPTTLNSSPNTFTDVYVDTVAAGGAVAITMPLTSGLIEGQEWTFKDTTGAAATNPVSILPNVGQSIDGGTGFTINSNFGNIALIWTGSEFSIKI